MKCTRGFDLTLNTVLPLLAGILLYYFRDSYYLPSLLSNHLADFLWAYAFISSILVIWDREPALIWMLVPFAVALLFEFFQYEHLIPGTGDVLDIITYYSSFLLALLLNYIFKARTNFHHEPEKPA